MGAEYGFVYFLSNDLMPGIYKIGFTQGHPQARVDQLSAATGCPMPFNLAGCFGTSDPRTVEQAIHVQYAKRRVNHSREFFRLSPQEVLEIIRDYVNNWESPVLTQPLDVAIYEAEQAAEPEWKVRYFLAQDADPIYWPVRATRRGLD